MARKSKKKLAAEAAPPAAEAAPAKDAIRGIPDPQKGHRRFTPPRGGQ